MKYLVLTKNLTIFNVGLALVGFSHYTYGSKNL